ADGDDVSAAIAVAQVADKRGGAHVEPEEGGGEQADLGVSDFEFVLDQRLDCPEHGSVNVIENVESGKQRQREARMEPSRHISGNPPWRAFGRGQVTGDSRKYQKT